MQACVISFIFQVLLKKCEKEEHVKITGAATTSRSKKIF
jgi:hypothetical protein